jgi:alkanesulfonate monooxygenase SsuD/methylene tetrahydromethanopterin reductase-like flavin-dependent oxidoreductase (luciferase family)
LKRAGTWADGYICGSSAISELDAVWEKIARYARAAGRSPEAIEKGCLTFMAIDDDKPRAVEALAAYVTRYYGRLRGDVENTFVVGSGAACAERINSFFDKGLDTLIIGLANADPKQLDLFSERVLPLVNR